MRVAVGSDHAGLGLKEIMRDEFAAQGHDRHDGRIAKLADLDRELVHPTSPEGTS
jgi:ribose 5-phosphate isomerase RpiB